MNEDIASCLLFPIESEDQGERVVLLAPLPEFWQAFQQSREARDGRPDPFDRYSKRLIEPLAKQFEMQAFFPSDGPPYPPFVTWAKNAPEVHISPVGLFVHHRFGLWISFRGALVGGKPRLPSVINPCENCDRPCLQACPVGAFAGGNYDVDACRSYVREDQTCRQGCLVRRSCPAAKIQRDLEQSAFHMRSFLGE